tara:strand:- start:109 stop:252 length:144 start_codon:yes stop_codon:yes gene_type:complete
MKILSLEAAIFYCARQLADEESIDEDILFELYTILKVYFEDNVVTVH